MLEQQLDVELVFATPERQTLMALVVRQGATVADVITASDIKSRYPDVDFERLSVGIWGREVNLDRVVSSADRVEIYRPLTLDPRDARRQLAADGRTMRGSGGD